MRRYNIVHGDTKTAKRTVVVTPNGTTHMGRDMAMVGDKVAVKAYVKLLVL